MKFIKLSVIFILAFAIGCPASFGQADSEGKNAEEMRALQKKFDWWPTDAQPGPVKDKERGGYWWWPKTPGKMRPWGNRGYVYVYKIIYDYQEEDLPPPKKDELRPSLLIKKIIKNVKIYFDYDKADIRDDAILILEQAVSSLKKNPETSILITGNCDIRGTEQYNTKLGKRRGEAVKKFMIDYGIPESRIRIISRGKLDAVSPVSDLVGMQKDRNAQFMIAEVEEVMIPYQGEEVAPESAQAIPPDARQIGEGKYVVEEEEVVESDVKVSTKEYITKEGDSLWKIAKNQYGDGNKWKNIYELNKEKIKNPNKLKANLKLTIPVE